MTGRDILIATAGKITTEERGRRKLSEQAWREYELTAALRHRTHADGLAEARDIMLAAIAETHPRPTVVVLCGSTRFYDAFQQANYEQTMAGRIVLSVGFYPHAKAVHGHGEGVGHDSEEKAALDQLHLRKIDMADEVLVLNVDGYVGQSTRREIEYAYRVGKPVSWLHAGNRATGRICPHLSCWVATDTTADMDHHIRQPHPEPQPDRLARDSATLSAAGCEPV